MQRRTRALLAVSLLVLGIPALALAAPRGAEQKAGDSFTVDVRFGADPLIDVGNSPPGPDVGDLVALDDRLVSAGRDVGHAGGSCVFTNATRPEASCVVTFALPRGTITAQWLNQPPPRKVLAVTGGTGIYRNARGEAVVVEFNSKAGTATFRLIGSPNRL